MEDNSLFKNFMLETLSFVTPYIREAFLSRSFMVDVKADHTPVTEVDKNAELMIRERIERRFPGHGILGEEFGSELKDDYTWVIDPIDGTKSFVAGVPLFGTLLALLKEGQPILGAIALPVQCEVYLGDNVVTELNGKLIKVRDAAELEEAVLLTSDYRDILRLKTRERFDDLMSRVKIFRTWGDCFGYSLIAGGAPAVMADPEMSPWDLLPLIPVIRGAGGVITGYEGEEAVGASSCLAGPPNLHRLALEILQG